MTPIQALRAATAVSTSTLEDQQRTAILIRAREIMSKNKKLTKQQALQIATEEIASEKPTK